MKINGYDITGRARGKVRVPRPGGAIEIEVEAFPLGFDISEKLPFPQPPVTSVRTRNGEVLRDSDGKPLLVRDETDKKFRAERDRLFWLRLAAIFYHATAPCGQIAFDADRQLLASNPEQFYSKVRDELEAAGFSCGDVNLVCEFAHSLSNMGEKRVEEFMADFSPAGSAPSESSEQTEAGSTNCSEPASASA